MLKKMRVLTFVPLFLFVGLLGFLWRGMHADPTELPSPLVDKPLPAFQLPLLNHPKQLVTQKMLMGKVSIINVWATWCSACRDEHRFWMRHRNDDQYQLIGFVYKDRADDVNSYLSATGNPYRQVIVDAAGSVAIDWGVYGTPETFIVDKNGIVREKIIGELSEGEWDEKVVPLLTQLNAK